MRLLIRVDSSQTLGAGHFMRCLTLAQALKNSGCWVAFVSRQILYENLDLLQAEGLPFYPLDPDLEFQPKQGAPELIWPTEDQVRDARLCHDIALKRNADIIVVDHYALDSNWELTLTNAGFKVMVVDDLANRNHRCDLLLDYTAGRERADYNGLVPKNSEILCGLKFFLLKKPIIKQEVRSKHGKEIELKKLGILMGATDPHDLTYQILSKLKSIPESKSIEKIVILGPGNKRREAIEDLVINSKINNVTLLSNPANYSEIIANLDFAISACGTTAAELIYLKIPSLLLPTAENQVFGAEQYQRKNLALVTTVTNKNNIRDLPFCFLKLLEEHGQLTETLATHNEIDSKGATRVIDSIKKLKRQSHDSTPKYGLRPLEKSDLPELLSWRSHPEIQDKMYHQSKITMKEHLAWFSRNENNALSHPLIFHHCGHPIGFVTFQLLIRHPERNATWGFYLAPGSEPGLGAPLAESALNYAFEKLAIDNLFGEVLANNTKSQAFHKKSGFVFSDNLSLIIDGQELQVFRYSYSKKKWDELRLKFLGA